MKVIFMGTPAFSVPSLHEIYHHSGHEIIAVVTNIDKPQGRGKKLKPPPVKTAAMEHNLPVIQVKDLHDPDLAEEIAGLNPDVFVVVAFRILPDILLEIPRYGALNLHASLLPEYRGPAPIQWALIHGEEMTGITIMQIDSGIDTGDILLQEKVRIDENETAGELSERLSLIGAKLIAEALDGVENDMLSPLKQDMRQATRAPKITPDMQHINWE
ncbi:methionyl-tRNA formyltransferase, partial [candidate division KSB1 bacterium]